MKSNPISPRLPKTAKRIPGKQVIWINGKPVAMNDADVRKMLQMGKSPIPRKAIVRRLSK